MRSESILTLILFILVNTVAHAQRPIGFVENKGQWPKQVIAAHTQGPVQYYLERAGLRINVRNHEAISTNHQKGRTYAPQAPRITGHVYAMQLEGAQPPRSIDRQGAHPTAYNYFLDSDQNQWAVSCLSYDTWLMYDIYKGIDFKMYHQDGMAKYDFIAQPGADLTQIRLSYSGMDDIALEHGRIRISLAEGLVYEQAPIAWQIIDGQKQYVPCSYILEDHEVHFAVSQAYDQRYALVIDPQIVFSSYSGSTSDNFGYTATYDEEGNLYSGSSAFGQGYPTTLGAYQITHAGGDSGIEDGIDMAISKYSADGTTLVWSTFIGGQGDDLPHSLIVNSSHELYIYGCSGSPDFPLSTDAYQDQFLGGTSISPVGTGATFPNGTDIVLVHLNASGSALVGSTYLGGSANDGINSAPLLKRNYADEFRGEISLDGDENPILVSSTFSTNFPILGGFQTENNGGQEAVIARFSPDLSTLVWSSYLGGSGDDSGFALVGSPDGTLYVTGGTASIDFITTASAYQTAHAGVVDGYVARLSSTGQLLSSTFYGASNFDQVYFIELDDQGSVYGYGQSISPGAALISNVGYSENNSGLHLFKLNSTLSTLDWSTVIGTGNGNPNLSPSAFLVDYCHRIYISGWGVSALASPLNPGVHLFPMTNLDVTADAEFSTSTTGDFYMAVFDENMTTLEYATFYGGNLSSEHVDGGTSRFDRKGVMYQSVCAGCGSNSDFPIVPADAWSPLNNSNNCNNGVYKFDFQLPLTVADFEFEDGCVNTPIAFTSTSLYAQSYAWNFGDNSTSTLPNPLHVYTSGGSYTITLIVTHPMTCNLADTMTQTIDIIVPGMENLPGLEACDNEALLIGPTNPDANAQYQWTPATYLNSSTVAQPYFTAGNSTHYVITVDHGGCIDTLQQHVEVVEQQLVLPNDTVLCEASQLTLAAQWLPVESQLIWSDASNLNPPLNDSPEDADIGVMVSTPTVFYAQITYGTCTMLDSVEVQLVEFQTAIEGDFAVCANDTTTLSVLDPNPLFTYHWWPENLIISGQNTAIASVYVPQTTTFTVVSSYNNCAASDNVTVTVSALSSATAQATADPMQIVVGQSVLLTAQPAGYTYQWMPIESVNNAQAQQTQATPTMTTTYYLTVSDGECAASDTVTVRTVEFVCGPPSIYVPNAFTPNKDGVNEKLYVRANNITRLQFVIYDRWGEKMFETQRLTEGWDGNYKGELLPPDVYTYYIEATCEGGSTYFDKGNITLIR